MLEGPDNLLLEKFLTFKFKVSNNQDEYEAFVASMNLSIEMSALSIKAKNDSQLIASHAAEEYR